MTFTISQTPESQNLILYPNGDGTVALTSYGAPPGSGYNYPCVDETVNAYNEETDYVYTDATSDTSDLYNVQNHTTESGTINYVVAIARAKSHLYAQSPSGTCKTLIKSGSTTSESSNHAPISNAYGNYQDIWLLNPDTAAAWSWSEIDSMQIGIKLKSASVNYNVNTVLRPSAAGVINQLLRFLGDDYIGPGDATNYTYIDEETPDDWTTMIRSLTGYDYKDSYEFEDSSETGTVHSVTIFYRAKQQATGATGTAQPLLYYGSTYYYGTESVINENWNTYWYTWTSKPSTGAWDWSTINTMQAGVRCNILAHQTYITQVYIAVNHDKVTTPELHCTQCYAVVNYLPGSSEITLPVPSTAEVSHNRNIERSLFGDGTYKARDVGRSGKQLTLNGTLVTDAKTLINNLRTMMNNHAYVTIDGLAQDLDTTWIIVGVEAEEDAGASGIVYDYTLSLEKYEAV
jgi:hypothetical protein